jgi:hypothetical protein
MQITATARRTAPLALPPDVAELLSRWRIILPRLLTDSNPKLIKGEGRAVILHHLPALWLPVITCPAWQIWQPATG